jgi:hypothetical protein
MSKDKKEQEVNDAISKARELISSFDVHEYEAYNNLEKIKLSFLKALSLRAEQVKELDIMHHKRYGLCKMLISACRRRDNKIKQLEKENKELILSIDCATCLPEYHAKIIDKVVEEIEKKLPKLNTQADGYDTYAVTYLHKVLTELINQIRKV